MTLFWHVQNDNRHKLQTTTRSQKFSLVNTSRRKCCFNNLPGLSGERTSSFVILRNIKTHIIRLFASNLIQSSKRPL